MENQRRTLFDGEWVELPGGLMNVACCDCGLVHLMQFEKTGRGVRFRAWRDLHSTRQQRRRKRYVKR